MFSDAIKACVVIMCVLCVEVHLVDMTFGELAAMQTLGSCLLSLLFLYYFQYFGISDDIWKKKYSLAYLLLACALSNRPLTIC